MMKDEFIKWCNDNNKKLSMTNSQSKTLDCLFEPHVFNTITSIGNQKEIIDLVLEFSRKNNKTMKCLSKNFHAINDNGEIVFKSTAESDEQAIRKTYEKLGDVATILNYKWI